jgi:hypothetical protein
MKRVGILFFLMVFSFGFGQIKDSASLPKNELKGNGLLLLTGFPEFSYERIINDESSFGVSMGFAIDESITSKFQLTPYYRHFFGKKPASGFYAEGFTMLNSVKPEYTYYSYDPALPNYINVVSESYTNFAVGFGLGGKWVSKNGFIFEIGAGVGRNLTNSDKNDFYDTTFVGRGGITFGYRF